MGLLDYADAARKKLAGLLGDMPLVQMAQGRAEAPTMGGLLASLKSMPVFSPDAGQSAYEAALNIGPMGLGKIVYHGSPHKFDKFDASKIGTGEGAQAYGHGVYLADSKGVAADYRNKLTADRSVELDAFDHENGYGAKDPTTGQMKWFGNEKEAKDFKRDAMGSLYKADLPDEWIPKMLDWDKPVPKETIEALAKQGIDALPANRAWARGMLETWKEYTPREGREVVENLSKYLGKENTAALLKAGGIPGIRYLDGGSRPKNIIDADLLNLYEKHGGNAQRAVDEFMGHVYESPKEKARMAAQFMKKLENAPTYNYVVFPGLEDQVKILERNGIPLSGLLGGK